MNGPQKDPTHFLGIGIGQGLTGGKLRFFESGLQPLQARKAEVADLKTEQDRLQKAILGVREELLQRCQEICRTLGESEAQIFEIHEMLLLDEDFSEAIQTELRGGSFAEEAVERAANHYQRQLASLEDPYLSARAADLDDIRKQLLRHLAGKQSKSETRQGEQEPYILVAEDLSPSQAVGLRKDEILGFVTFGGSPSSHTSILARAMGIPALVGVGKIDQDLDGAFAILDATNGRLIVSPDQRELADFWTKRRLEQERVEQESIRLRQLASTPAVSRSGQKMLIYANVGDENEAESARKAGADGIGLLRSELFYLSRDHAPNEEELLSSYVKILSKMEGKRVIIRTLDVGADKQIPYLGLPHEENPALGFRAVRVCLARKELFQTQLRAILRAARQQNVAIMLPMIVSVREVLDCKDLLEKCKGELQREGLPHAIPELGVMIETPAAALMSEELAGEVDFFSVGTNDLLQYTLAADRQNPLVSYLERDGREPLFRLIKPAVKAIHKKGGWIGICGELAAELSLTQAFLDLGIDELSVSPPSLLPLRGRVMECQ